MAYNNGFPITYGQMYPQIAAPQIQQPQMPQMVAAQPQQSNGLIWVLGEAGAKSYLVAPNTTLPLWDSEAQVIYLKSADASGMPSMKILDYTIREGANSAQKAPLNDKAEDYVTKDELEALRAEIAKKIEGIKESMGV